MHYTDKEMINMLTNVCPLSFNKVVDYITQKIANRLYYFVLNNGGRKEDVGEILNDALMAAHDFAIEQKFKDNTSVEAFIFQVSKYKFRRKMRNEKKTPLIYVNDMPYDISDTLKDFDEVEDVQISELKEVINNLKTEDKQTLIDFYWEKMTMKEIAAKYNLGSEQAARNKLYRIRERLKKKIKTSNANIA